jgi:hypothetical protein
MVASHTDSQVRYPSAWRYMLRFRPGIPPGLWEWVAAFRLRDPDLTPSTRQEGEVRIPPTPLRTN